MRARLFLFIALLHLAASCVNPAAPPTAPVTLEPLPVMSPPRAAQKIPVVQITTQAEISTHPNEQANLTLHFAPQYLEQGKTSAGTNFTSLTRWENANVTQLRVCMELEKRCEPGGEWMAFSPEWKFEINTDWLGKRAVWLGAQFRDRNGNIVRVYDASKAVNPNDIGATEIVIHSTLDERTPIAAQPAFAQTAVAATRAAFPVSGSLVLQNGMCCAGGKVGTTISINAAFDATSPNTTVTQMRLLNHCGTQSEMNTAAWEPFVKQKTFSHKIAVPNWVGWYLAVQYRDANGKLSPIYCADISIEGMP